MDGKAGGGMRIRKQMGRAFTAGFFVLIAWVLLFPLLVTITNSFMAEAEITSHYNMRVTVFDIIGGAARRFARMQLIPNQATLSQYLNVLVYQPSYLILLINSIKLTVPVVLGNVVVSFLTAYGFSVWRWKYKEALFFVYILVMLMPLQALLVPNYIVADALGIKDSYLAIILPGIFAPFGTFLLRQSMKSLPPEYFEAAEIDGANSAQILLYLVVPQMKSGVAALTMLVFIEYWNLVEQAVIFIREFYREPLSIYLSRMTETNAGVVFAASCIYMLPPLWFLFVGQSDLEKGIELSGIK